MINKRVSTSPVSYVSQKMVNLGGADGQDGSGSMASTPVVKASSMNCTTARVGPMDPEAHDGVDLRSFPTTHSKRRFCGSPLTNKVRNLNSRCFVP
jgi:hypothetical protein